MSQQSVLPALLPSRPSLTLLRLHHLSSLTVFLHHTPPSSPDTPPFICISCSYISPPCCRWCSPDPSGPGVPDGLTGPRFSADPSAADPLLPQTPGGLRVRWGVGWEGTRFSNKMRGRGQERDRGLREACITAKPVIYCISSSNSLCLLFFFFLLFSVV